MDTDYISNIEDAFNYIVKCLKEGIKTEYSSYGYDLYLVNVVDRYAIDILKVNPNNSRAFWSKLSPVFYSAAWELCRRGILRPGVKRHGEQVTDDGSGGCGYSITVSGIEWIKNAINYDFAPIEPGRISKIFNECSVVFGDVYAERSQEAIKCYNYQAYLACCTMCGASTESIILSMAFLKTRDEEKVLKDYNSSGGRGRVENSIIGQQSVQIQNEFRSYSSLLKYWRDASAHGMKSNITDNEAFTSLALLLRFSLFARDNWSLLTK